MKKILTLAFAALLLLSCGGRQTTPEAAVTANEVQLDYSPQIVNLLYFHGTQRCKTCIAVGEIVQEVYTAQFSDNKNIVFTEVNTDDPKFKAIAEKYKISWSSLVISKGETITDMTDFAFANAIKDPDALRAEIAKVINTNLSAQ